jgi:uncharacterized oxidoreductase
MKMTGNTILITGGATGIGYLMAKYFCAKNNTVIICGRRRDRLIQAQKELQVLYEQNKIHSLPCDVADPKGRYALLEYAKDYYPNLNILINNAGIQRDIDLTKGTADLVNGADEIWINFEAPIYLSALFTPFLAGRKNAVIVNISSGIAFMPECAPGVPVYCATKAALHAFSVAQRIQLAPLGIRVVEIIPPMVESELNYEGRKKRNMLKSPYMLTSDEFVGKALAQMEQDMDEIRMEKNK